MTAAGAPWAWAWPWAWLAWPWLQALAALVAVVLLEQWWHQRHFARRGLPSMPALPFVGCIGDVLMRRMSYAEFVQKVYRAEGVAAADAPAVGFFEFRTPIAVLRDPDLLRDVAVKQFDHFRNHRPLPTQKADDLFGRSLFALEDQRWRDMRATMSPAFTASKMRVLFDLIGKCGRQSADYLERCCRELPKEAGGVYEMDFKDFIRRFTTDVIATSAFGIECDSMGQPDNEFYVMGNKITNFGGKKELRLLLMNLAPKLAGMLGISFFSEEEDSFFRQLVREALQQRAERGIYRPDVLQLLMEARDGRLGPQTPGGQPRVQMTDDDIMAQSMLFFFAGFETVSILICFSCHLLATHPDVQERLQREIDDVLETNGGEITYEEVQKMKYLDMIISETLRLFPPAPMVDRRCAGDVALPQGDGRPPLALRKGDVLWLPIFGLHRDARYWPRPDAFDPERFSDDNKHRIQPFTYMPFGAGPRFCLAQRFALLEAKVALVHLLRRVRLSRVARTHVPVRLARTGFNTASADGYWCGVSLRAALQPRPHAAPGTPVGAAA